mmetsp:Transcript_39418/g.35142  ORF Transcript_39418/g.35142 Transcript_39418/m.35142 type:complete len:136 (+) Transcript_39418:2044-2451(+)
MGEANKEYKLFIYVLKPGAGKATITFTNESTSEYVFYKLNLNCGPPEVLNKIEMTSPVRESTVKVINFENPLKKQVSIGKEDIACDNDNLQFYFPSHTIAPETEYGLEVQFRPLVVGEKTTNLTIKHKELGEFPY